MQAVYEMAVEQKDRVAQGRALWQLGSVLGDQGQFKNAEVPLRDALVILESELGSDHLDIAKACNGSHTALITRTFEDIAKASCFCCGATIFTLLPQLFMIILHKAYSA